MLVRRSKTELDHDEAKGLDRGIHLSGFHEPNVCGCKPQTSRGDIAMALEANGKRFCKVVHTENGRTWTRRIHTMMVQTDQWQAAPFAMVEKLPDSISLYSGVPYSGAHLAEVLLNPKEAKATPLFPIAEWLD